MSTKGPSALLFHGARKSCHPVTDLYCYYDLHVFFPRHISFAIMCSQHNFYCPLHCSNYIESTLHLQIIFCLDSATIYSIYLDISEH